MLLFGLVPDFISIAIGPSPHLQNQIHFITGTVSEKIHSIIFTLIVSIFSDLRNQLVFEQDTISLTFLDCRTAF